MSKSEGGRGGVIVNIASTGGTCQANSYCDTSELIHGVSTVFVCYVWQQLKMAHVKLLMLWSVKKYQFDFQG